MRRAEFEEIYVEHYARLVRFARIYLNNSVESENVVQDLFMELWNNRSELGEIENPLTYLLKSTKFRAIDLIRKNISDKKKVDSLKEHESYGSGYDMISLEMLDTDLICDEFVSRSVKEAIDTLPEQCRKIFIMNKFEGIKQKDIAEKLGITVNSVETQMGIAYKKLRSSLKNKTLSIIEISMIVLLLQ